jgi:protein gp37
MAVSSIEWTEVTWNPVTGCSKISAGCKNCYAEKLALRLQAMGQEKYKDGFKVTLHPDVIKEPFNWRKPRTVFVNSMSDLFHEDVPLEFIKEVFKVMNQCKQHTFQILTKRADRLLQLNPYLTWTDNIWMGVSVEDERVLWRIDKLVKTDSTIKWISFEPLIGPLPALNLKGIQWAVVGGESGPKARPMSPAWVMEILKQCEEQNVPFFFKQWGQIKNNPDKKDPTVILSHPDHGKGGALIQGKIIRNFPFNKQKEELSLFTR